MARPYLVHLWAALQVVIGYFIGMLIKVEPMISGSGIPQVEGLSSRPIYESLLELIVLRNGCRYNGHARAKVLLEIPVSLGTSIESKMVKEISWPPGCLNAPGVHQALLRMN